MVQRSSFSNILVPLFAMTRNSSSSESAAPDAQKEQIEVTPPSTAQQAQQATSFNVEPISKDGFHIHERDADETNSSSGLSSNPFEDPDVAEHWAMVYEKAQYECRGEFDPTYTWTPEEEKRLIRKLDFRVCAWACVMFFGLQVDRGNLKQAVSDNMLDDLNLNTNGTFSFLLRERERERKREKHHQARRWTAGFYVQYGLLVRIYVIVSFCTNVTITITTSRLSWICRRL